MNIHQGRTEIDGLRIAVVHEWVATRAGSEQVFEQLARAFPKADLYCLTFQPGVRFEDPSAREITTSPLDHPWLRDRRSLTLPLMPAAWRAIRRPDYDLVVSSSHAFGRFFAKPTDGAHLSYVHAPMRYAWDPEIDPRLSSLHRASAPARAVLRAVDRTSLRWTKAIATNSREVARRIERYYRRSATVIHPPVELDRFDPTMDRSGRLVALSRFVGYKRLDLAIEVAERVGLPLDILGSGPGESAIRQRAGAATVPVKVLTRPSDAQVAEYLGTAAALIFPAREDFGIVPVEAQASGTPVLGLRGTGLDDSVVDRQTGVLVDGQGVDALTEGLKILLDLDIKPEACSENARRFSVDAFRSNVRRWTERTLQSGRPDLWPQAGPMQNHRRLPGM